MRLLLALVCLGLFACSGEPPHPSPEPWADTERVRIHAPDLSGQGRQQDLYLLEFKAPGAAPVVRMLIDAGNLEEMQAYGLPYLQRHGVKHLDRVYITHPHKDHYGGMSALLDAGITVGELVMNPPLAAPCDREQPWGCDFAHVQQTIAHAVAKGVKHQTLYVDDPLQPLALWQQEGVELALWFAPHGVHPTLGELSINDTSMFMRLQVGDVVHAFTGDMNVTAGDHLLAQLGPKLKADVLKVPHHAAESTVSNAFFNAVSPTHAWVSSHVGLWCSERSRRVKDQLKAMQAKKHVMGLHGDVLVRHYSDRATVWSSTKNHESDCGSYLARLVEGLDPVVWSKFELSVDRVSPTVWGGVDALSIRGWQFPHDKNQRQWKPGLGLLNEVTGAMEVFSGWPTLRQDVPKHFPDSQLRNADVGVDFVIPYGLLSQGRYALVMTRYHDGKVIASKTNQSIEFEGGTWKLSAP